MARPRYLRNANALGNGLPRNIPLRWNYRNHLGITSARLRRISFLLRGGSLPLRALRNRGIRNVCRILFLVAKVHRAHAQRASWKDPLLDTLLRLPHNLPYPALARN